MTCPNKNLESWKQLVNEFGEGKALAAFTLNNFEIPSLEDAYTILKLKTPPNSVKTPVSQVRKSPDGSYNIWAGSNENTILSNLALRPFIDGADEFQSVEQYFQYQKWNYLKENISEEDFKYSQGIADKIMSTTNGFELKKLGRMFKGLDINSWDRNAEKEMRKAIRLSFEQNPDARSALLSTGESLLTHNQDKGKWGKDFPKLLMEVRDYFISQKKQNNNSEEEINKVLNQKDKGC